MMQKIIILNSIFLSICAHCSEIVFDFDVLNRNLFESLKLHPKLNVDGRNLTQREKNFINKYVEDYYELTSDSLSKRSHSSKSKRSLSIATSYPSDEFGNYVLSGIEYLNRLPIYNSSKFEYFEQSNKWFLVTLQQPTIGGLKLSYTNLVIFKIENGTYSRNPQWVVHKAEEFSVHSVRDSTYIIVKASEHYYSGVWMFDGLGISKVQSIDMENVKDVEIWETDTEMHMAISGIGFRHQELNLSETKNYNTTFIYRWTKYFFNRFQVIDKLASKVMAFQVDGFTYLLLSINKSSNGEISEIYRYNLAKGEYEIHQRIPTFNCRDVKFFSMKNFDGYDRFIIVANYISGEDSDEIPPIIYKYVDGYFLPFQNIYIENVVEFQTLYLPKNAIFLLLSRTEYQGLKTYQYDGWIFQETLHEINSDLNDDKIINAKFDLVENNKTILVLGFEKDLGQNVLQLYSINFEYKNEILNIREETLKWCETSVRQLSQRLRQKRQTNSENSQAPTITDDELVEKINSTKSMLKDLEQKTANSLQYEGPHIIQDLKADEIVMNDPVIRSLSTEKLNNENVNDLLNNLININKDDQWPGTIVLKRAQIDSQIHPDKINGKNIDHAISSKDNVWIKNLKIMGETRFSKPVITETLNNISFDEEHVLLLNSDQNLRLLDVEDVRVETLNLRNLYGAKEQSSKDIEPVGQVSTLKADRITIGGLINEVSVGTLEKYALRTSGNQFLTEKYFFENLIVDEMIGKQLNEEILDDLVRLDAGFYRLDTNVEFEKPLTVNNLSVKALLDTIPVSKGKLQVLLKDTRDVQYVKAEKLFNNLEILSSIELRGNIKGGDSEKINPTVHVEGPLIFQGDYVISGNTTIEQLLLAKDIRSANGNRSVKRVLSQGIPLNEKEIYTKLNFNQQLIVDEVNIDKINGVDPKSWVVTGTPEQQIIRGHKTFLNDVYVTGNIDFLRINSIAVSDLENNILRKTGDQVITGKHTIVNVYAKRIMSNNTIIGNNTWKNILTTKKKQQVITGTTIVNADIEVESTAALTASINGTVNGYNFTEIAQDTVTISSKRRIDGHKTFENLTAVEIGIANMDIAKMQKLIVDGDTQLENAEVENLRVKKTFNEIKVEKLSDQPEGDADFTVSELTDLDDLVVLGNIYIESNYLGDMDLYGFERDTVKIDEEHVFGSVSVDNTLISESAIELYGDIERVDLDNLVKTNSKEPLTILDQITILSNLTVLGSAFLEAAIKGVDVGGMCKFLDTSLDEKELDLVGNVVFVKGPKVSNFSNKTLKTVFENVWLKNKEVHIDQEISFKHVTFRSNVTVKDTVDGVDLKELEKEYFSKSKDQAFKGGIYFTNNVIFANNLNCPEVTMNRNGEINGMKIQELPRIVLLQDMDQVFEGVAYFENIVVEDLEGEFTVNNLSLEDDLMLYDKKNIVTGTKHINSLIVGHLELKKNTTLQNVDVIDWIQNAISKKGTFIVGKGKTLKGNVYFDKSLNLMGPLNGQKFNNETIMLKSVPQKVTGKKTFEPRPKEMIKFKNLKLKGLLNDMHMSDLLDKQSDNVNMILKSPVHFYNDISTKNINLRKPFRGVDIERFISDAEEYEKSDLVERYAELLNMTVRLNRNLRVTGFQLLSYKNLQEMQNAPYIVNSCCDRPTLMYFDYINSSYILYYYYWDQDLNLFEKSVPLAVDLGYPPVKTLAFTLDRHQFLYMEYASGEHNAEGLMRGQFWRLENLNHLIDYGSIRSDGILQIMPLHVRESECILLIYVHVKSPHIFCDFNLGQMRLIQGLPSKKYVQSESLTIDGIPFLILLHAHEDNANISTTPVGVEIWCLHEEQFGIRQVLYFSYPPPKSISTVTYRGNHYLSIVYRGDILQGHIDILRYSKSSGIFEQWYKITSVNQVRAEFSILPSGELFFFVLGPSKETLSIYKYVGISGFKEEIVIPSSKDILDFKQFPLGRKHFIMVSTQDKLNILQAQFKGNIKES